MKAIWANKNKGKKFSIKVARKTSSKILGDSRLSGMVIYDTEDVDGDPMQFAVVNCRGKFAFFRRQSLLHEWRCFSQHYDSISELFDRDGWKYKFFEEYKAKYWAIYYAPLSQDVMASFDTGGVLHKLRRLVG